MQEVGSWELSKYDKQTTNESLFSARPGGRREIINEWKNVFEENGSYGYWWSSSIVDHPFDLTVFKLSNKDLILQSTSQKARGYSVRCLKD